MLRLTRPLSASAARSFEPNRVHEQSVSTVAADHHYSYRPAADSLHSIAFEPDSELPPDFEPPRNGRIAAARTFQDAMVGCAHTFVTPGAPDCRRRRTRSRLALAVVMKQTPVASLARTASMNPVAALRAGRVLLWLDAPQAARIAVQPTATTRPAILVTGNTIGGSGPRSIPGCEQNPGLGQRSGMPPEMYTRTKSHRDDELHLALDGVRIVREQAIRLGDAKVE